MKNTFLSAALLSGLLATTGCSSSTDSKDVAEKANDKKIEKADSAGTRTSTAASEGDAKDVADYVVTVANNGMTEYQLSEAAAGRATTPAVKAYASATVKQHAQDEQELKAEAAKHNITLPTTLSNDSQDMLTKLGKETKVVDFEKKYLDDMVDINDKAISKQKDLVAKTTNADLKQYAQKMMSDDEKHLAEAKALRSSLK